jgi:hypothetical protein
VTIDPGFTPSPVSGFDPSTGMEASNAPTIDLSGETALAGGGNVLWDLSHGPNYGYTPAINYSNLVTLLNGAGFNVYITSAGLNNVELSAFNLLVINGMSSYDGPPYTAGEVDAIKAFVFNGGGLLVMGDNPATNPGNIQPVSQAFGTTVSVSSLGNSITNFSTHPIFAGISQIQFIAGGELSVTSPAGLIAWDASNKGAISVASYGGGKVLALGDINLWENDYIASANNQQFALNVFSWLSRWLTVSPVYGWTSPGGNSIFTVSVDSTGLGYGSYFGGLAILSNAYAPGTSPLIVPVTLVVYEDMFELPIIIR